MPTRADAEALDAADPLAAFRDQFFGVDDDEVIYANGNSLGRLPVATVAALERLVVDEWGRGLVASWESWIDVPERVGDAVAAHVVGGRAGECVIADSTTVNFFKLAAAALALRPDGVVVTDSANFPTDRYVLGALGREVRWLDADPSVDEVAAAVAGGDVALVALSHVSYRSGARLDLAGITAAAHSAGALVLWDLSHSAGAVGVGLAAAEVDLAVGCTYKYLNAGPGAPAFLYVRRSLQESLRSLQPIQGWFGAADQFAMGPVYEPAAGVRAFVSGTPSVSGCVAVGEGVRLIADAGLRRLEAKAAALTEFLLACADDHLLASPSSLGYSVATPRDPAERGAHVSFRHPDAARLCSVLVEREGLVCDFREPEIVRVGLAPLYSRFVDAFDAVERLARAGSATP